MSGTLGGGIFRVAGRYLLDKVSSSDTLSFLFRTSGSGRAEVGLIGDDDFTLKVAPDGSTWVTALGVDKTTGKATFVGGKVRVTSDGVGIGTDPSSSAPLNILGTGTLTMTMEGAGASQFICVASAAAVAGPFFTLRKARGTPGSPSAIAQGDHIGTFVFVPYASGAYTVSALLRAEMRAASPSSSDTETRLYFSASPAGSATPGEVLRIEHATGLSMFGANPVIDNNRHIRLRPYTLSGLPSASPAAQVIYVSDVAGGNGVLVSDGSLWRRAQETGTNTRTTDAAFTLTPFSSSPQQFCEGTLTADRAITLATTNVYDGCAFRITRTGSGAFNYTIAYGSGGGSTKSLAQNTWAEFTYSGSAGYWKLAAAGSL